MNIIYFEIFNGFYLSDVNLVKKEISYSINEDDRLWFDGVKADIVENMLTSHLNMKYRRLEDESFVQMISNYLEKGIMSRDEILGCYKQFIN